MELRKKINYFNKEVEYEIQVRDELLQNEQKLTRKLRGEIVKAKDVLMSAELHIYYGSSHQVIVVSLHRACIFSKISI